MSPDLEGRRAHVVMGCRALAREPIMCQQQQASKRAGQGAREGKGVVNTFQESMYYVCGWVELRRYLGYTRLDPKRGRLI